jgi:hypothetical protein
LANQRPSRCSRTNLDYINIIHEHEKGKGFGSASSAEQNSTCEDALSVQIHFWLIFANRGTRRSTFSEPCARICYLLVSTAPRCCDMCQSRSVFLLFKSIIVIFRSFLIVFLLLQSRWQTQIFVHSSGKRDLFFWCPEQNICSLLSSLLPVNLIFLTFIIIAKWIRSGGASL